MPDVQSPRILVTVDCGELGALVARKLRAREESSRIAGLSDCQGDGSERLHSFGIDFRKADYESPESLDVAFVGIDRFLFVSPRTLPGRSIHNRNIVDAAARAGVKFVGFTSGLQAERSPFRVVEDHLEIEEMLRRSGIAHTTVRNGWCEDAESLAALAEEIALQKREGSLDDNARNEASRRVIAGAWSSVALADTLAALLATGATFGALAR